MQQIADWLETARHVRYAQRFAENDIDFSVLPDLTDQDLKELGVPSGIGGNCCAAISRAWRRERVPTVDRLRRLEPKPAGHRRAPPSHGDVLGPRRFDGTLGPHGP